MNFSVDKIYIYTGSVQVDRKDKYEYYKVWIGNRPELRPLLGKRVVVVILVPDEEL
ncbi:hypothetical protein [Pyrobaculum islandicum]|uniref:hypothetical protein n=1 Tax=Pyrobaculum islandicum TaxID=2277 RepID=UPI000A9BBA2D|nr:hypothetical protein [Pyrobaculum islandicum]